MPIIDLNSDIGESESQEQLNRDFELLRYVTSCNIACGFHAGSPVLIQRTVERAIECSVKIGAHPSFDDRENFGRSEKEITEEESYALILYQIAALQGIVGSNGGRLHHVKPHGALYNQSARELPLAKSIYRAVKDIDPKLSVYGLEGSAHEQAAKDHGVHFISEAFADRAYNRDGSLVNRKLEGALITDPKQALNRVKEVVQGKITTIKGEKISTGARTICFHSDSPNSVEMVKYVKENLDR